MLNHWAFHRRRGHGGGEMGRVQAWHWWTRRLPLLAAALLGLPSASQGEPRLAALYPKDGRRDLTGADLDRYKGAGVLWCRRPDGVPRRAAAAWLIADPTIVVLNAHNFRSRRLETTRQVSDCYFQIAGRNYDFVPDSLHLGTAPDATALHITDDWAILRLATPADVPPQPLPQPPDLPTGDVSLSVTMVSPAGHENYRGESSLEHCTVRRIDPPGEDGIRRIRHDCNDGYGGSGSGLFDEGGRLLAMQSASSVMNAKHAFDPEFHYGSALLFEGQLTAALATTRRRAR
ncbi:trypsin-like peptidase domain-containing protein [Methylobacterium sp. J-067]|uniref:trypsin-like peptidase domain-containing protein n=1 Tax=Methylobacterium sp. J-067 TaxID=2836648 RepID=UPI001FBAF267|nr:trypsin-like peptidase domain-containing protein [Methylobacterium sp. J-067]MCJ2023161.1 serine protease [Methylobacterium sp. J-067]